MSNVRMDESGPMGQTQVESGEREDFPPFASMLDDLTDPDHENSKRILAHEKVNYDSSNKKQILVRYNEF